MPIMQRRHADSRANVWLQVGLTGALAASVAAIGLWLAGRSQQVRVPTEPVTGPPGAGPMSRAPWTRDSNSEQPRMCLPQPTSEPVCRALSDPSPDRTVATAQSIDALRARVRHAVSELLRGQT
jgi:hypothetical protein